VIDLQLVRDDPERVRASQRARREDEGVVDVLRELDERRRAAEHRASELRAAQKELGRRVAKAADKAPLLAEASALAAEVRVAASAEEEARSELRALHLQVPNVVAEGVPPGGEDDYAVIGEYGPPPRLEADGPYRDHLELGEALGAIDVARGAKVSGARFAFLTGWGARLELALVNAAMDQALGAGFVPVVPPVLVQPQTMEGTGYLGAHADEVYRLADDELYLVGTSEVPLAAFHAGEILDDLPRSYAGFSSCFRREAGSYGKDTRGIIRVHQFDKVEMFVFTTPEDAPAQHERLLAEQRRFLDALELPHRVIDVAAGDLGTSAARKFDCEAWLPSQGRWMEVTSTSNCTDYQARRLGIRHRGGSGTVPVATLNGTLCAVGRTIVALLEHHQRRDGSVAVPAALRPYLGGVEALEPVTRSPAPGGGNGGGGAGGAAGGAGAESSRAASKG
jgi:seryl-tRNA synthetase